MGRPATISDVARLAQVGIGSVSRVINQAPSASPDMVRRVRQAMATLGYTPPEPQHRPGPRRHPPVRPRPVIELVNVFRLGLGWMPDLAPVYARVLDSLEPAALAAGLDLRIRQSAGWPDPGADDAAPLLGRLYFGTMDDDRPPPPALRRQPAVWMMGPPPAGFTGDSVQVDHLQVGRLAATHLLGQGHRHGAYLGLRLGTPDYLAGYRGDAFRFHLTRAGGTAHLLLDPDLVHLSRRTHVIDGGRLERLFAGWPRLRPRPTALFVQSDMFLPAVHRLLRRTGLKPERDVALIACDNEPRHLRGVTPAPAVIDIRATELGACAVDTLLRRHREPDRPALRILVQPRLVP
jgi:LacI family transcriptional regulator